jgi:hypothetical protein
MAAVSNFESGDFQKLDVSLGVRRKKNIKNNPFHDKIRTIGYQWIGE